jgi:hypothetical protein
MGKEFLIRTLVSLLGEYLLNPISAAPYKKYLLRGRDYLNLLLPVERFPPDYGAANITGDLDRFALPDPKAADGDAAKTGGKRGGK